MHDFLCVFQLHIHFKFEFLLAFEDIIHNLLLQSAFSQAHGLAHIFMEIFHSQIKILKHLGHVAALLLEFNSSLLRGLDCLLENLPHHDLLGILVQSWRC